MFFRELVEQEKNKTKDIGGFNSFHEVYGVLMEEVDEFFDEVKLKPEFREPDNTLKELVQIAAIVERAAEDLYLVEIATSSESDNIYKQKYDELSLALNDFLEQSVKINPPSLQQGKSNNSSFLTLQTPVETYNKILECLPPTSP